MSSSRLMRRVCAVRSSARPSGVLLVWMKYGTFCNNNKTHSFDLD